MEKDVKWRDYFEDNCRYADIINGLGCAGTQLVSPEDLTELDTSIFKTDVRHVFDFLRCCENRDTLLELVTKDDYYQNVDQDAYEVIAKYANTKGIINLEMYKNSEGGIDMCKGLRDLITDSKAEGRAEALVHTYQKLKQPKEDAINTLIDDYNIPKEDAIKFIEKYWK